MDTLQAAITDAETAWTEAVGGGSVCRADRSDPKRAEGAVAALRTVRRHLGADADVVAAIRAAEADWTSRRRPSGPLWDAYGEGGCEALAALRAGLAD